MLAIRYLQLAAAIIERIRETQHEALGAAGRAMADAIADGGLVHVFGSGHSVIPAMDMFPRYGSFVGFHPLLDPRLMWFTVIGSGGVRELLWLERREGYVGEFLRGQPLRRRDVMLVFSHGGLNAAPIEAALFAREVGLTVIGVTSLANHSRQPARHSTGMRLADCCHVVIDNCAPPEDALVSVGGWSQPVAASSTLAAVAIGMALVAETAGLLAQRGIHLRTFVSPNVSSASDHNERVFAAYIERLSDRGDSEDTSAQGGV